LALGLVLDEELEGGALADTWPIQPDRERGIAERPSNAIVITLDQIGTQT
jgi:hypothetical protein